METSVRPGDVLLGKYRVEHVLGQGGMGVVVAARHIELGELFAIKFLLPQEPASSEATERFLREARASARLKGEHVAKVHDVGRLETGAPYMVMEHLSGSDLRRVIRKRGPLPVEEAATYVLQACEAIAEAHAIGIVHRDIKPGNLFLTRRPNGMPCVKVLDFGISKQVSPGSVELTQTGALLGSPLYMSPEQMTRSKDVDARSDIWSMGVVLYELVTGTLPFRADSITEVIGRVLQEEAVPPSRIRPGLPAELDAIVGRCLQKRVEQRFQSIGELAAALGPLAGGSALLTPLPHAGTVHTYAVQASIALPPAAEAHAAMPHAAMPHAAVTGSAWGTTGAAPRGRRTWVTALGLLLIAGLGGGGVRLLLGRPAEAPPSPAEAAASTLEAAPPASGTEPTEPAAEEPGATEPAAPAESAAAESTTTGSAAADPTATEKTPAAPIPKAISSGAPPASTKGPDSTRAGTATPRSTATAAPTTALPPQPTKSAAPPATSTKPKTPGTEPTQKKYEGVF